MKAYFFDFGKGWRDVGKRGSVILYVLVVVALISLLFVGWLELMTNRVRTVDVQVDSMKRRLAYENARVLLRQYLVDVVQNENEGVAFWVPTSLEDAQKVGTAFSEPVSLADGWVRVNVSAWSKTPVNCPNDINIESSLFFSSSSGWFGGTSALAATLEFKVDGEEEEDAETPLSASVVLHRRLWVTLDAYVDAAVAAATAKAVDGDVEHLVDAPSDNWYEVNDVINGAGEVTLKLNEVGLPLVITVSNARELIIEGEPLDSGVACTVYVDQSATALTDIRFVGSNGKPFYLGVSNPPTAASLNFEAGTTWEVTAVFEQEAPVPAGFEGGESPIPEESNIVITIIPNVLPNIFPPDFEEDVLERGWDEINISNPSN